MTKLHLPPQKIKKCRKCIHQGRIFLQLLVNGSNENNIFLNIQARIWLNTYNSSTIQQLQCQSLEFPLLLSYSSSIEMVRALQSKRVFSASRRRTPLSNVATIVWNKEIYCSFQRAESRRKNLVWSSLLTLSTHVDYGYNKLLASYIFLSYFTSDLRFVQGIKKEFLLIKRPFEIGILPLWKAVALECVLWTMYSWKSLISSNCRCLIALTTRLLLYKNWPFSIEMSLHVKSFKISPCCRFCNCFWIFIESQKIQYAPVQNDFSLSS